MTSIELILELPKNVIQYIQEFLFISWEHRHTQSSQQNDEKNWRNFMNINQKFYSSLTRKETIFIQLNYSYSLEFLTNLHYQQMILGKVISPKDQIGLQFQKHNSLTTAIATNQTNNNNNNTPPPPPFLRLHYVQIRSIPQFQEFSFFQNIYQLEIHDCERMTDISYFINVHSLHLSACLEIYSVAYLPNLFRLSVMNCHNIPITEINKMNFPNLQELFIRDQRLTNQDLSLFGFITKKLSLHGPSITNIATLHICQELELSFCFNLKQIPITLSALTKLSLQHCHQVKTISHLSALQQLTLYSCHQIDSINFTQLHALSSLEIAYCPKISTLIFQTSQIIQQKLQSLKLSNNFQLKEMNIYYQIAYCDINQCPILEKISIDEKCKIYFLTFKNQNKLPLIEGRVNVCKEWK